MGVQAQAADVGDFSYGNLLRSALVALTADIARCVV